MSTLPYDLALRLKNAGFPYKPTRLHFDGSVEIPPTLEELVDACGDGFFKLIRQENNQWYAGDESNKIYGTGSTPLIAVAHLWLALNEKV